MAQIFDSFKIQNVSSFYFEERAAKKAEILNTFKEQLFRNGGSIDMNLACFDRLLWTF